MYTQKNSYYSSAKKMSFYGRQYDSKFEAEYGLFLESEKQAGRIKSFETHVPIDLVVNGYHVCTYKVDFKIYHNDNTIEFIETKGWATDIWRLKWKLFEATYENDPNVKLTVVMQGKGRAPRLRRKK